MASSRSSGSCSCSALCFPFAISISVSGSSAGVEVVRGGSQEAMRRWDLARATAWRLKRMSVSEGGRGAMGGAGGEWVGRVVVWCGGMAVLAFTAKKRPDRAAGERRLEKGELQALLSEHIYLPHPSGA